MRIPVADSSENYPRHGIEFSLRNTIQISRKEGGEETVTNILITYQLLHILFRYVSSEIKVLAIFW